jgi:hypothetical protein
MAEPSDIDLYNEAKREVDKSYDKPSAYRSMAYTRTYLKKYREKYGDDKKAYKGKNPEELKTWRKEKWIDVKSVLQNPKNPTACGNAPIKKGEYPLCMPVKEIEQYSKGELQLLVNRKNEIGKKRLVKDAFLRDVLKPEEIPVIREYKEKYNDRIPIAKPLTKEKAAKILKERPVKVSAPSVKQEKEPKPPAKQEKDILKNYPEEFVTKAKEKLQLRGRDTEPQAIRNVARKLIRAEKARQVYIPKPPRPSRFARDMLPKDFTPEQVSEYRKEEKRRILAAEARAEYVPKVRSAEPYRKKETVKREPRVKQEKQTLAMLPEEGVTLDFS